MRFAYIFEEPKNDTSLLDPCTYYGYIVPMNQAESIIAKFGGIRPMTRILGFRNASQVQGWKERGYIPARQQQRVLDAARCEGIELTPADFFEDSPQG